MSIQDKKPKIRKQKRDGKTIVHILVNGTFYFLLAILALLIIFSLSAFAVGYAPSGIYGRIVGYDGDLSDLSIKLQAYDNSNMVFSSDTVPVRHDGYLFNQVTTLETDGKYDLFVIISKDGIVLFNRSLDDYLPWEFRVVLINISNNSLQNLSPRLAKIKQGQRPASKEQIDDMQSLREGKNIDELKQKYDFNITDKPIVLSDNRELKPVVERPQSISLKNIMHVNYKISLFMLVLLVIIIVAFMFLLKKIKD